MRRLKGGKIIPQAEDWDEEDICARDWERMRAAQIVQGVNKPNNIGRKTLNVMKIKENIPTT